jgi:hypothetical protein
MSKAVCITVNNNYDFQEQPNIVFMHIIEIYQYLYNCYFQDYSKQYVPKCIEQSLWL